MRRARGGTLPEVLIASVLSLLVMGVSYSTMLLVNRCQIRASARVSALVNAEVGLDRIRREMQEASLASVSVAAGALSFTTARDDSGRFQTGDEGAPEWQATIVYYVNPGEKVLRRRRLATSPPLTAEQLDELSDGSGRIVAYEVADLTAAVTENGQISLELTCETETRAGANKIQLATDFIVRHL